MVSIVTLRDKNCRRGDNIISTWRRFISCTSADSLSFKGTSHMNDQNVMAALDTSLGGSTASAESGEARTGSAEATSLFTGSPSRASQVEGDQIAESSAVIDPSELHEQNAFSSAPDLTAVASEFVSVLLSFLSRIAPHTNHDLTALIFLLIVLSLLKSRFNRDQVSHRSPLCWISRLPIPVKQMTASHCRTAITRHKILICSWSIFQNRLPLLLSLAWLVRTAHP